MKKLLLQTLLLLSFFYSFSQTPTLVKDLTPSNNSTQFGSYGSNKSGVVINNTLFTIIDNSVWKSDGTDAGTTILKTFYGSSTPIGITKMGSNAYFGEYDYFYNSTKLWKSDGTVNGTVYIKNINGPIVDSKELNGVLFFLCTNMSTSLTELWRTDGTESGTYFVKNTNRYGGSFFQLEVLGNEVFFTVSETSTGVELWKSDISGTNITLVKDIYLGSNSSYPSNLKAMNGYLYFSAQASFYDTELWRTDGTNTGTTLVKDIYSYGSSNPINFQVVNNKLIFYAYDDIHGGELWVSDGTAANTFLLKDINPGFNSSSNFGIPMGNTTVNGVVTFIANDGTNGYSLWKTDGTSSGTTMIKDLITGNNNNSNDFGLFCYQTSNLIYYVVVNDSKIYQLWQTDGTEAGTVAVKSLNNNVVFYYQNSSLADSNPNGTNFYFTAYDTTTGIELWKTNGTPAGVSRVKDITTQGFQSSNIKKLNSINGYTFFTANNIINGNELWRTDGTSSNTILFYDFTSGINNGGNTEFGFMTLFKNQLYIQTNIGNIWRTDGTQLSLFANFPQTGALNTYPSAIIGDYLYFVNGDNINNINSGLELFKTDGNTYSLVKDINPNYYGNSFPENFCSINNTLYFTADDGINGRELWKSDGTNAGTTMVKDITLGSSSTTFNEVASCNGLVFFMTDNYSKLWRSDGTESGTFQILNVGFNNMKMNPKSITCLKNKIYFKGYASNYDGELWESDGTVAGTRLTKDIAVGYGSHPTNIVIQNDTLYFDAASQFWKSDGTTAGTVLISSGITPYELTSVNGMLNFYTFSNGIGYEPWQSNGTASGSSLIADIYTGTQSSFPNSFHYNDGNKIYFIAENYGSGKELYTMNSCRREYNITSSTNFSSGSILKKEASNFINANNKMAGAANVRYDAGKFILLDSGFEVSSGSVFKAYIDGCNDDESPSMNSTIKKNVIIENGVKNEILNFPSIEEFWALPANQEARIIYQKAKNEFERFQMNKNSSEFSNSIPNKPIFYIIKGSKKGNQQEYILTLNVSDKEYFCHLLK